MKKRKPRQVKSKVYNYQVASRRRHPTSSRWIHGLILLVLIAVATGIAYVWQRNRLLHKGYTLSTLQREIAALENDRKKLEADVTALKKPDRIQQLVHDRQLGLGPPSGNRTVYLPEPKPLAIPENDEPEPPLGEWLWDTIVLGRR
jgi:cell division protein FtsL